MIRILIADDHPIVRSGLKHALTQVPDIIVVAEAATGEEVIDHLRFRDVDVVLLDVTMPGMDFFETMKSLKTQNPDLPVLILTAHPEEQYGTHAIRAGAVGYVTKDQGTDSVIHAIRTVHSGGRSFSPSLESLIARRRAGAENTPLHEVLSRREMQVLRLIGTGKSVTDISHELNLSPKTVSTYRTRIREKTRLLGTVDMIRYAVQHGLVG